ncbi:MAG: glycosyltransferase family 2 protein [Kiloniellales bacterium]
MDQDTIERTRTQPLVSVIIPVFNRADKIVGCLRSVCNQTYRNIEVIVVDDCSTDETLKVIAGFRDNRLKVIASERNGGAASARNHGLKVAKGDFIAFQDSDDFWLPEKIETQIRDFSALSESYVGLYSGKILYGKRGIGLSGPTLCSFVPQLEDHDAFDSIRSSTAKKNHVTMQSLIIRRNVIDQGLRFDDTLRCNEDWDFALQLSDQGKIAFKPKPHCLAMLSDDSISRNKSANVLSVSYILRKHTKMFKEYPKHFAWHLYGVSRYLAKRGKPRSANIVLTAALKRDPLRLRYLMAYALHLLAPLAAKLR